MKKIALLIFSSLLFLDIHAQKLTFGPMVGAGFNVAKTDLKGYTTKANGSFLGGVFVRVGRKRVYLQPELYYSNKVANLNSPSASSLSGNSVETQVKTGNVNVNALLGLKLLKLTSMFNVRIFAGPSTALIVAKSLYQDGTKISSSPNLKSTAFNLQAGVGVDISKLTIDVRYERGMSNLSNSTDELKINSVLLTVGFTIL